MAATDKKTPFADIGLLAAAGCALLTGLPNQAQAGELENWDFDAATLLYVEGNSRVSALEPVISATRNYDSETKLNLTLSGDTLTGASPNGATPSDQVQTFTSPSGKGDYQIGAGEQPLDDTFRDTRGALAGSWSAPLGRDWAYSAGGHLSAEHDYTSIGANGTLSHYFNLKNTTLTLGLSLSNDLINPEGGVRTGLSAMPAYGTDTGASSRPDSDSKNVTDVVLGLSQVIDKQTLMQVSYSISASDGYLNDPYKIVSVIDDQAGSNYGGNYQQDGSNLYLYEKRPDTRTKQAVYWQVKHQFTDGDILDLDYRFMTDDWGIQSHTIGAKYRIALGSHYLEPQLRWYTQGAADFYHRYLTSSEYDQVSEASADYRLGEMDTYSIGFRYGYQLDQDREFYTRVTYYQQQSKGEAGFGKLADQELYPTTEAYMLTLGYRF